MRLRYGIAQCTAVQAAAQSRLLPAAHCFNHYPVSSQQRGRATKAHHLAGSSASRRGGHTRRGSACACASCQPLAQLITAYLFVSVVKGICFWIETSAKHRPFALQVSFAVALRSAILRCVPGQRCMQQHPASGSVATFAAVQTRHVRSLAKCTPSRLRADAPMSRGPTAPAAAAATELVLLTP